MASLLPGMASRLGHNAASARGLDLAYYGKLSGQNPDVAIGTLKLLKILPPMKEFQSYERLPILVHNLGSEIFSYIVLNVGLPYFLAIVPVI